MGLQHAVSSDSGYIERLSLPEQRFCSELRFAKLDSNCSIRPPLVEELCHPRKNLRHKTYDSSIESQLLTSDKNIFDYRLDFILITPKDILYFG